MKSNTSQENQSAPITPNSTVSGAAPQRLITPRNLRPTGFTLAQHFGQAATQFGKPQAKMLKNMPSALLSSCKDLKSGDKSDPDSNESQSMAQPLKDNDEVSPAPVSRFTPRALQAPQGQTNYLTL